MPASIIRAAHRLTCRLMPSARLFLFTTTHQLKDASTSTTSPATATPTTSPPVKPSQATPSPLQVSEGSVTTDVQQAPNRLGVWSRSQRPRAEAMTGPRFEQTDFSKQPQPWSAMELVHKEPVRWTHDRLVACNGGGGPAGHPKIFINTDKPEIAVCGYCGLPFASEHNRKYLEMLPETSYPL